MKPEKRELIESLMDDTRTARREAALRQGGRILFQRRFRRMAFPGLAAVAIFIAAAVSIPRPMLRQPQTPGVTLAAPPKESGSVTDDQLLGWLQNTPAGLMTLANGNERLIFPRPGDKERLMAKF